MEIGAFWGAKYFTGSNFNYAYLYAEISLKLLLSIKGFKIRVYLPRSGRMLFRGQKPFFLRFFIHGDIHHAYL